MAWLCLSVDAMHRMVPKPIRERSTGNMDVNDDAVLALFRWPWVIADLIDRPAF